MQVPPEDKVHGWQEMIDYMDSKWATKKGVKHYPWNGKDFKTLYGLCANFGVGGVMAMWDIYLEGNTYWGQRTGHMVDGLMRDIGVILDDRRYKSSSKTLQEKIDKGEGLSSAESVIREIGLAEFKIIGGKEHA